MTDKETLNAQLKQLEGLVHVFAYGIKIYHTLRSEGAGKKTQAYIGEIREEITGLLQTIEKNEFRS